MALQNGKLSPILKPTERDPRHLTFCGLMGVGKTTVGAIVADQLSRPLFDNDRTLKMLTGHTAAELALAHGVDTLHQLEGQALIHDLRRDEPAILTAAAGTIEDAALRQVLLARSWVVWLDADPAVAARRTATGTHRPDLGEPAASEIVDRGAWLDALRTARAPLFESVADLVVDTTREAPASSASRIVAWFRLTRREG